jgi:rubredoxin
MPCISFATINDACETFCVFVRFKNQAGEMRYKCSMCDYIYKLGEPMKEEKDSFEKSLEKSIQKKNFEQYKKEHPELISLDFG